MFESDNLFEKKNIQRSLFFIDLYQKTSTFTNIHFILSHFTILISIDQQFSKFKKKNHQIESRVYYFKYSKPTFSFDPIKYKIFMHKKLSLLLQVNQCHGWWLHHQWHLKSKVLDPIIPQWDSTNLKRIQDRLVC